MSISIRRQLSPGGDNLFYTDRFRGIIESHLNILKTTGVVEEEIPGHLLYQFEGNFYGYLNQRGVPLYLHWIYLRVNGMENPNQFGREQRDPYQRQYRVSLKIPSGELIDSIRALYLTTKFKT